MIAVTVVPGEIRLWWEPYPEDRALYRWPNPCRECGHDRAMGNLLGLWMAGAPGEYVDRDVIPDVRYDYDLWIVLPTGEHEPSGSSRAVAVARWKEVPR